MNNTNVQTHLEEMQQFLKLSDNINMLLHNFDSIDTADSNDLYDLVYNKKKIENWLKEDIENEDIKNNLQDILNAINIVVGALSDSQIEIIMDNNTKDIHKLNKLKYGNKNEYKGLKDNKTLKQKKQDLLCQYIIRYAPRLLIVMAVVLFIHTGGLHKISTKLSLFTVQTLETTLGEDTTTQDNNKKYDLDTVQPDTEITDSFSSLIKAMSIFIGLLVTLVAIMAILKAMLDIMYVTMPIARSIIKNSMISEEAKQLVELANYNEGLEPSEVDYRNRIETATALLHNIDMYVESLNDKDCKKEFSIPKSKLMTLIKDLNTKVTSEKPLQMIDALVDAEALYINLNLKEKLV